MKLSDFFFFLKVIFDKVTINIEYGLNSFSDLFYYFVTICHFLFCSSFWFLKLSCVICCCSEFKDWSKEDLWDVELFKEVGFDVDVEVVEVDIGVLEPNVKLGVVFDVDVEVEPNEEVGICEDVGLFAEVVVEKGDWVELIGVPNTEFVFDGDVCLFEVDPNVKVKGRLKDDSSDLFWLEVSFFFVFVSVEVEVYTIDSIGISFCLIIIFI